MSTNVSATSPLINYIPKEAWLLNGDGSMTTFDAGATAEFSFNGVWVQVFGTIPLDNGPSPVSTYTLDGTSLGPPFSPSNVSTHEKFHSHQVPLTNQVFYQSPPSLPSGDHSLIITSTQPGANFTLGSILYASSFSSSTPSFSFQLAPTSSPSLYDDAPRKHNVGGIIGGVLAALIAVAVLIAFVFFRRRRRQKAEKVKHRAVTPFVTERNSRTSATYAIGTPTLQAPYRSSDEKMPIPIFNSSHLSRHGSTYKPKNDSDGVPPLEFGYGGSV